MGADLYIEKIHREFEAEWRPRMEEAWRIRDDAMTAYQKRYGREVPRDAEGKIDLPEQAAANAIFDEMYDRPVEEVGYYRDSYNASSVMWKLGLSWWNLADPDEPRPFRAIVNGRITARRALKLLNHIRSLPPFTIEGLRAELKGVWEQETDEEVLRYFNAQRARLERFLMLAVESKEGIRASV